MTRQPQPGDVVLIKAFYEMPEHEFMIDEVLDDCVTGVALTGRWPRNTVSPNCR